MVRRMVGVLAEVGRGALAERDVDRLLREPTDAVAPLTAPPSGLFLERVLYDGDPRPGPLRAAPWL
jgi:tRNA pseudouridine38-40 synthase